MSKNSKQDEKIAREIGRNIKSIRKRSGLKRIEFAKKCGVCWNTIYHYETRSKLSAELGVRSEILREFGEDPYQTPTTRKLQRPANSQPQLDFQNDSPDPIRELKAWRKRNISDYRIYLDTQFTRIGKLKESLRSNTHFICAIVCFYGIFLAGKYGLNLPANNIENSLTIIALALLTLLFPFETWAFVKFKLWQRTYHSKL